MQIFKYHCSDGTGTQLTIVQWFINLLVAISGKWVIVFEL